MAKNIKSLLLYAFANVNPNLADRIKAGSVGDVSYVKEDVYGADILDADGKILIHTATWKRGTFGGVMGLDPAFDPVEQEEPGDVKGVFKKSDGSVYLVLEKQPSVEQLSEILNGYDFSEAERVTFLPDENKTQLDYDLFFELVPTFFIDPAPVSHVDLP